MKESKLRVFVGLLLFIISVFAEAASAASVPQLINYQGRLTDANGNALTNGTKKLSFSIYDKAGADGIKQWGPQVFPTVPVINGYFNIILGPTETDDNGMVLPNGKSILEAFKSDSVFLEITVGDGSPISPRQQILSTPFSIQAKQAELATHHSNIIPVGMIAPFFGTIVPDGWLICNGDTINSDPKYNALKSLIGNNVPDLRDMFLRGKNGSRTVGDYQADAFQGHRHKAGYRGGISPTGGGTFGMFAPDYINVEASDSIQYVKQPIDDGVNGTPRIANETRPKNIAINYIIKY